MELKELLKNKKISMYRLSKISGVPKTTIIDICSGKSSVESCKAGTIYQLSKALDCKMEDLMNPSYDYDSGLPTNKDYLEKNLPPYLQHSLETMIASWKRIDSGNEDYRWDAYWCELNADIRTAEVERVISSEQASYLRKKYLRME